jgi:hypothetical protein
MTNKPKKITFRFGYVAIPPSDPIWEDEERLLWYTADQCKMFKLEAANHAGVLLFDSFESSSPSSQESSGDQKQDARKNFPHFVMVGDFDDDYEDNKTVDTEAATCKSARKCTNEYNDTFTNEGEVICKRGLGYHFSRRRKRNKAWVRSMLMAYQKDLGSIVREKDPKRDSMTPELAKQFDAKRQERYQLILAKVYIKCTQDAKKSALWRGRMDYEVAYPNRYEVMSSAASEGSFSSKESESKKRPVQGDDEDQMQDLLKSKKRPTLEL